VCTDDELLSTISRLSQLPSLNEQENSHPLPVLISVDVVRCFYIRVGKSGIY